VGESWEGGGKSKAEARRREGGKTETRKHVNAEKEGKEYIVFSGAPLESVQDTIDQLEGVGGMEEQSCRKPEVIVNLELMKVRKEEGGRRKEEGGRRKEEGGRRKRRREEGGRRRQRERSVWKKTRNRRVRIFRQDYVRSHKCPWS
jgi:hypothetical protein